MPTSTFHMKPNAARQPLPEAEARHERTLEAVGWTRLLGAARAEHPSAASPVALSKLRRASSPPHSGRATR